MKNATQGEGQGEADALQWPENVYMLRWRSILLCGCGCGCGCGYGYNGFPGGPDSRVSNHNSGDLKFDPWVGKIPWRREQLPTLVFFPGEVQGQRRSIFFIHSLVHRPLGCSHTLVIVNDAVTNMGGEILPQDHDFLSFGYICIYTQK